MWRDGEAGYNKLAAERAACELIIAFFEAVPTPAIQLASLLATTASHHNTARAETVARHLTHFAPQVSASSGTEGLRAENHIYLSLSQKSKLKKSIPTPGRNSHSKVVQLLLIVWPLRSSGLRKASRHFRSFLFGVFKIKSLLNSGTKPAHINVDTCVLF